MNRLGGLTLTLQSDVHAAEKDTGHDGDRQHERNIIASHAADGEAGIAERAVVEPSVKGARDAGGGDIV